MAIRIPERVKPVFDFAVHVLVGALLFSILYLAAVAVAALVKLVEHGGFAPPWLVIGAGYLEIAIFGVDVFCFGLFLLSETLNLMRRLWRDWKAGEHE